MPRRTIWVLVPRLSTISWIISSVGSLPFREFLRIVRNSGVGSTRFPPRFTCAPFFVIETANLNAQRGHFVGDASPGHCDTVARNELPQSGHLIGSSIVGILFQLVTPELSTVANMYVPQCSQRTIFCLPRRPLKRTCIMFPQMLHWQ